MDSGRIEHPTAAQQHVTAGPYSPVLMITPGPIAVISGQAALDLEGNLIGETITDQTHKTIENCRAQLAHAGCDLDDVFKVNVFLADLNEWSQFNEVYKRYFTSPMPVRTAIGCALRRSYKVELEMWAAIPQTTLVQGRSQHLE
ncbi:RidA family protein [Hoeflea sp. G2-23]|uniref:RidA family protein n=1 Tax=Hoeflea algicola TaxID=2983763 RepID=A0ABT3Z4Y3_9HYPH|nr:RidA family protein [Hoeflea algicola]MCY0146829.1 RidA family protein [Hoeflea algicola]